MSDWYLGSFGSFRVQRADPDAWLREWASVEFRESLGWLEWLFDEYRLQAKLEALADDDGMPVEHARWH